MRLRELVDRMRNVELAGTDNPGISGIVADSRDVVPGSLFAALPGYKGDGAAYIGDAVRRGAAALLLSCVPDADPRIPYIVAADVRKGLGEATAAFYDNPAASLDLVGVTGTNGKTTTAYLVRHVFNEAGRRCGMLGTVEYDLGDKLEPAPLTTPDTVRFTRSLAEMRDFGCTTAAVEVSSHALAQDRVWPHRFACAIFTNLTRDHLDYHGDMDSYREAKRLLFARLDNRALAVLNFGDLAAPRMAEGCAARRLDFRVDGGDGETTQLPEGCHRVEILSSDLGGQAFRVTGPKVNHDFRTPLVGRHNVENCVGVILAAIGLGVGVETVARAIADFPGVPGRLERIESPSGAVAFIDYSHTDGALRSVLSVLRPMVKGRLITVFGCGGDRDKGKRPLMAKAAEAFSDIVIVTSDNPRTEDAAAIIRDIVPGFDHPDTVRVDIDRAGAVNLAASLAGPDDAILVAGKGHEDYQIIGTVKHHLDDRELVRDAFARNT